MASADESLPIINEKLTRKPVPRRVIVAASIISIVCALTAFVILLLTEHPAQRIIVDDRRPVAAHARQQTPASSSAVQTPAKQPVAPPNPVEPAKFTLVRSRNFQTVGPLKLKLGRTDSRRGLYDLSVAVESRSFVHRKLRLSEALWVSLSKGSTPVQIVITRIQSDRVVGYWVQGERPIRSAPARRKAG